MTETTRKYLVQRWRQTLWTVKAPKPSMVPLEKVLDTYEGTGRFYHTTQHLRSCFEILDLMVPKLPEAGILELALWYHDFVYDTHRHDNEEASSIVAVNQLTQELELPARLADQVRQLILVTNHKNEPWTQEARVLLDVDLSILGSPSEVYWEYEEGIRKEYAWVEDKLFREIRGEILVNLLERDSIYHTREFRNSHYERQARENLTKALNRLAND